MLFVTKENQIKPWLLFEAGALSKGIFENGVCTFLVDLNVRDIESSSPLSHLKHTSTTTEQILELIRTINKRLQSEAVSEIVLQKTFEAMWEDFSEKLEEIKSLPDDASTPNRTDNDILNDILENVLSINKKVSSPSLRQSKLLEPLKAREILKLLLDLDVDHENIMDILSGITPAGWVKRRLVEAKSSKDETGFDELI